MQSPQQQIWPDRRFEILGSTTPICILSTVILIWRVVCGVRTKRKLLTCDYLLVIAAMMNVATTAVRFETVGHGLGRHILDPSISKPHDILQYSYFLWLNQIINLLAVAVFKYSICWYLLALSFSRIYICIIYASILMVTAFNLIIPTISVFSCTPFEANWNRAIKGDCFMTTGPALSYTQATSNIITDVIYVVAPIVYLSTIQLPRRTQWGLRIVFCLGIIVTVCSIMKTRELSALRETKDPTWDGVNLSIWSATELSVGILIASLPPLRKEFDKFFRAILPSSSGGTRPRSRARSGIQMYNTVGSRPIGQSKAHDGDDDSERGILPGEEGGITKTVVHEVVHEDKAEGTQTPVSTYSTCGKV